MFQTMSIYVKMNFEVEISICNIENVPSCLPSQFEQYVSSQIEQTQDEWGVRKPRETILEHEHFQPELNQGNIWQLFFNFHKAL